MFFRADRLRVLAKDRTRVRELAGCGEADTAARLGVDVLEVIRLERGIYPLTRTEEDAWFAAHGFEVIQWWELAGE